MKEKFDVSIEDDFENLTVKLFLHRINRNGFGDIILKILEKDDFINIIHKRIDFNLINKNEKNISSNLEKIEENKNDINDINLSINKIPNIENNITKNYNISQINKKKLNLIQI